MKFWIRYLVILAALVCVLICIEHLPTTRLVKFLVGIPFCIAAGFISCKEGK